jgi:hypothetical protein
MDSRVPQAVLEAAARRAHRAAVARTLDAGLPWGSARNGLGGTDTVQQAPSLDWAVFDQAPPWLALDGASLCMLRRRVGSVLLAPALRLWIAAAKVNAAREAVGHAWWWRLLDHRPWPDWSSELAQWGDWPAEAATSADAVAEVLDDAGAAVLLATLPHGALRHAASLALGSSAMTTPMSMPQAQAQAVLGLTLRLLQDEAFALQAQANGSGSTRDDGTAEAADEAADDTADDAAATSARDGSTGGGNANANANANATVNISASATAATVDARKPADATP